MPSLVPLHPATRLVVWAAAVGAGQALEGAGLVIALLAAAAAIGADVRRRWLRLVSRARWLLLSLLVLLAWGTPGELLWSGSGAPTLDGIAVGATQAGRLLLMLAAVALLLETMPMATLLAGIHALLRPLARLGWHPEPAVARLALVLEYAETLPPPRDWRALLAMTDEADDGVTTSVVRIERQAASAADYAWAGAAVALAIGVWLR